MNPLVLIVLSGLLVALTTTDLAPGVLGFGALLPLLLAIDASPAPSRAALAGWLGGVVLYGVGLAWAPLSGVRGIPLAVVLVYVAVLAASFACYAGLIAWLRRRDRALCFALAPALWIALEYARSRGSLGYPWQHLGYALADYPGLLALASVGGVYALSLWMVALQSGAIALRARPRVALAWVAAGLAAPLAVSPTPIGSAGEPLRVAAVQPRVLEIGRASDAAFRANLSRLLELSDAARAGAPELVVWPESAYERTLGGDLEPLLDAIARAQGVPLVTGLWRRDGPGGALHNSAVLADPVAGVAPAGDKVHPVPFWEGTPAGWFERALASVLPWPGAFRPGARPGMVWIEREGGSRLGIGVLICLDSSYPGLARDLRRRGASLLVELSNEALTGAWSARQHARVSRLRALESGLSLVRVANTGPSEWIDPGGRVLAGLPADIPASATVSVPIGSPAPAYARLGDTPCLAASLIPGLAVAFVQWRRRAPARSRRSNLHTPNQEVLSP